MRTRPVTQHQVLVLVAVMSVLAAVPAANALVEVKLVFEGLGQSIFEQKYANATLEALSASAGVPENYITRLDKPAVTAPVATPRAPSAAAASTGNVTKASVGNTASVASANSSSSSSNTTTNTTTTKASSKGARRLLAVAPELAPPVLRAQAVYAIRTSESVDWASTAAVQDKLVQSAQPPGYSFFANLARRGVPYEPSVFVNGAQLLEGRSVLSTSTPRAGSLAPGLPSPAQMAAQGDGHGPMVGPLPVWVFIPVVILGSLLTILFLVGMCVLGWRGFKAVKICWSEEYKQSGTAGQDQFIVKGSSGEPVDGEGLIKSPGGGYAPTLSALEKLNASFPNKACGPGSKQDCAASVISAQTVQTTHTTTTMYTNATTARSTAGLMAAQDGKKGKAAKNSSSAPIEDPSLEYYKAYKEQGKPVPILPHSRIVKPGKGAIKVPVKANSATGSSAGNGDSADSSAAATVAAAAAAPKTVADAADAAANEPVAGSATDSAVNGTKPQ